MLFFLYSLFYIALRQVDTRCGYLEERISREKKILISLVCSQGYVAFSLLIIDGEEHTLSCAVPLQSRWCFAAAKEAKLTIESKPFTKVPPWSLFQFLPPDM